MTRKSANKITDVLVIGASEAGLMCAIKAGKRGRKVLVLDHANKAGKKILMSSGGRCNFTNNNISAENFISHNPHFCKSALSRYTQWDFIDLVEEHQIPYEERKHGQLFCKDSARDILNMLLSACEKVKVTIQLNCDINKVQKSNDNTFILDTSYGNYQTSSLVIASGGLSIPKMGASPFGYQLAEQFGHHIWPTTAGLVPFTLHTHDKEKFAQLSRVGVDSIVSNKRIQFRENVLFTHQGLSGPAILQISSYWKPGEAVDIRLLPELNVVELLKTRKDKNPNIKIKLPPAKPGVYHVSHSKWLSRQNTPSPKTVPL